MNNFSEKLDKREFEKVRSFFENKCAVFSNAPYMVFRTNISGIAVSLYESGKILFQGSDVSELVNEFQAFMSGKEVLEQKKLLFGAKNDISFAGKTHIGVDESGKGDFFGPLVIAGVLANEKNSEKFINAGVKDSKKLSDDKILALANLIKANAVHSVVVLGNEKYNELYAKINNLNKLLAWGHARVIENILEKEHCEYALSDKFGKEELISNALLEKGKQIKLEQRCRGEDDIAVAAASVLARAEYVKRMESLSSRYEIKLPKGANSQVLISAKEFVNTYGKERLKEVAKTHFKTYNQV